MKARILYIAAPHQILEHDDLRILHEAGFEVFSLGHFANPSATGRLRGSRPSFARPEDYAYAVADGILGGDSPRPMKRLTAGFVDRFDLILVTNRTDFIAHNADVLFRRPVIFRSVGQSTPEWENLAAPFADRLTVVRYSPREVAGTMLPTGAVIRFGKYAEDYLPWNGGSDLLLTFYRQAHSRPGTAPTPQMWGSIVHGANARLYDARSQDEDGVWGEVSESEQRRLLASCRAYVLMHPDGAPYSLSLMEAMMAGAPILAPSARLVERCNVLDRASGRYEVEDVLGDGAGLIYNSTEEARNLLDQLDAHQAQALSGATKRRAVELFDAHTIARQWSDLIGIVLDRRTFAS